MFLQTSHTITEERKDEALDLIKQLAEKLGIPANLPEAGKKRAGMGQASTGYVQDCIAANVAFPNVVGGGADAAEMQAKFDACLIFDELLNVLWPLAITTRNLRRLHGQDLMIASKLTRESFVSNAKNRPELKPTADKLKQRYARARKDEAAAKKSVPKDDTSQS
jgi:hypothetical protein